jgi:putative aldouronate transport system permease protein
MAGLQIAFRKYNLLEGISGSPWIGFDNFIKLFSSYNFTNIVFNTFILSFYELIVLFPLAIGLALIINSFPFKRYKKIFQTISVIPYYISTVVVIGMVTQLFNPRVGAIGAIYSKITGTMMRDILGNPGAFRHIYVWSSVWQNLGWHTLVFLSALSAVNKELSEAAEIDGASRFKRVIHIDFPCIKPTVIIMLILNSGRIMNIGFEKVYLLQNRLNLSQSEVVSTYIYRTAMSVGVGDFSFATAIGLFNTVINFSILLLVNFIASKYGKNKLW